MDLNWFLVEHRMKIAIIFVLKNYPIWERDSTLLLSLKNQNALSKMPRYQALAILESSLLNIYSICM